MAKKVSVVYIEITKRKSPKSCLMGTQVYWEGIDLPGKQLEVLVIVKLPFPNISDPMVQAWTERLKAQNRNAFREYLLPEAVLELKQGIGRLLRGAGDRGVVLLLDNRVMTEPYGISFARTWKNNHQVVNNVEDVINACTEFLQPSPQEV